MLAKSPQQSLRFAGHHEARQGDARAPAARLGVHPQPGPPHTSAANPVDHSQPGVPTA